MTSRIPPSRRDPEFAPQRAAKALSGLVPGAGRVAGVARPGLSLAVQAALRGRSQVSAAIGAGDTFYRDRFALVTSGAQSLALTQEPKANSAHVYLNGVYRDEGTDYTLSGSTLSVLTAMGATSGDVVEARYVGVTAGTPASAYRDAVLADTPAVYLRLGDPTWTTAVDASGNGRDGAYSGTAGVGAVGLLVGDPDTCVSFDGVDDLVSVPYGTWMHASNITVEAVIRTSASGVHSILDRDDALGRVFQFRMNASNKLEFILIGGSVVFCASSASINDGNPHHVAATYDGSDIRLYIDGVADGTTATAGPLPSGSVGVGILVGANSSAGPSQFWDGEIDEAAYYVTDLTAGQIAAHFTASGL